MGTIEELGLNLVRKNNHATIFLPDSFPFSVQSLGDTIETIRNLFGDDAWGLISAGFTEQDGMGIMFYLPQGKEDEGLETARTAGLPLLIEQPEAHKPQLKLLAAHENTVLIEPSQVITAAQIRDMIRTRLPEVQEIANGHWRVSLYKGYLKMHTQQGSFGPSVLQDIRTALVPAHPHTVEHIDVYVDTKDSVRIGTAHVRLRLDNHVTKLIQEILDEAALPGFTDIASSNGHITATYEGPETQIVHPINQATALKKVILDFMLKLGVFPAHARLHIGLPTELNQPSVVVIDHPFGVIAGHYPHLY